MNIKLKGKGRPKVNTEIYEKINLLKKGDKKIIKNIDWKQLSPISRDILRKQLKREFMVQKLADESGVLITAL